MIDEYKCKQGYTNIITKTPSKLSLIAGNLLKLLKPLKVYTPPYSLLNTVYVGKQRN